MSLARREAAASNQPMWDKRAARVVVTVLLIAALLGFCWAAWRTLMAFVFAIFFAYLLEAPVERLTPLLKGSRKLAVAAVYCIMLAGIALLVFLAAPRIMQESQSFTQQLPQLTQQLASGQIAYSVGSKRGWSAETERHVQQFLQSHRDQIISWTSGSMASLTKEITKMWWLLLVPILAVFFLLGGSEFRGILVGATEGRDRRLVTQVVDDVNQMLGHFIRAQLALAAIAMLVLTLAFWAMRVPYGFALGPLAGAMEFIPVVGPVLGGALALVIAFAGHYSHLLILLAVLVVWRGVQDYVNSPKLLGSKLELHPLAVLFGVLAGGEVGGVIGVFLSIPIMAAARIL